MKEDRIKQICIARDRTNSEIEKLESYVKRGCKPSNDGLWDGDDKITIFKNDLENRLITFFLYEELILKLQKELSHEFSNIHPGLNSAGVCLSLDIWQDVLTLRRNLR